MVLKTCYKYYKCNYKDKDKYDSPCIDKKILCPLEVSSILCDDELLSKNTRLKRICCDAPNKYFFIKRTNTVIMVVENKHCILIDYEQYIFEERKIGILACKLSKNKYYIQRKDGRDWTDSSSSNYPNIAYDIREIIHGYNLVSEYKSKGYTVDHGYETYNEKVIHTYFKSINPNEGSHRVAVVIANESDLNDFIDDIIKADQQCSGVYFDKNSKEIINRGRRFVFKV